MATIPAGAVRSGPRHPEILAEIERLQASGTSLGNTLLVLLASLALFVGASQVGDGSSLSLETLLILVPLLLFHESGHYLAMKLFGYRNLKMFFIPFFGAAVTGRHYNVPGWKKAVVSLMGPLPGVVLGGVVGTLGLALGLPLLVKAGLLALALNGLNLLPILPLDGGWVVHVLLFSRHAVLDVVFRLAAVLGLAGLSIALADVVLGVVAAGMALSIPAAWTVASLTGEIRRSGLQPVSEDDATIPADVADQIAGRVVEAFPKGVTHRQVAQQTLDIFETLNARPPGLGASLVLGTVHVTALVAAVVLIFVLAVGQHLRQRPVPGGPGPRPAVQAPAGR